MELAYLAITVPQSDQEVNREAQAEIPAEQGSFLDSIPTVVSPSSTRVNTPNPSRPTTPIQQPASPSRSSILGKRASQDRESNGSPKERPKRSDVVAEDDRMSISEGGDNIDDFEIVNQPGETTHRDSIISEPVTVTPADQALEGSRPSPDVEIENLKLKSPVLAGQERIGETDDEIPSLYPSPSGPPPLPPRPRRMSKAVLEKGLEFGKCIITSSGSLH